MIKSVDICFPTKERPLSVKNLLDSLSLYNKRETIRHNVFMIGDNPDRDCDRAYRHLVRDYDRKNGLGNVVYEKNEGDLPLAELWTRAAKMGDSEFILIFNDDCEATNFWLDRIPEAFFTEPKVGAVAPKIVSGMGTNAFCGYTFDILGSQVRIDSEQYGDLLAFTPFPLVKRAVFEEVGGYRSLNGHKMYYEDADFGLRLWCAGNMMVTCPQWVVLHKHEPSPARQTMMADVKAMSKEFTDRWEKYFPLCAGR